MFELKSNYKPSGDQPKAIQKIIDNFKKGKKEQVLLGATGTGKTFTISNVIQNLNKPTLVIAHNKTLAGQLYAELKEYFPNNAVEYFVSYYDYYQPEAYVPSTDNYIEKDSSINEEIDELRHSATASLISRNDVIVVASVSCIYGIGEKEEYKKKMLTLNIGDKIERNDILTKLVEMYYERTNLDLKRGSFRVRGDMIEILLNSEKSKGYRIELFDDKIEKIIEFETISRKNKVKKKSISIFPASHFVTSQKKLEKAIPRIEKELEERLKVLEKEGKFVEKQRLEQRTKYDIEMLKETGFCSGVENYSRHLSLREEGETPSTLIDFFPDDFLLLVDESHVTLPQIKGMYNGDRARKQNLVDYGFRLPSALDNRPLRNEEFKEKISKAIYVTATPGDYELEKAKDAIVEQIIRPTGLLDPTIEIRPTLNQMDSLIDDIKSRKQKNERVLITTLTIRMAEELTEYLKKFNIKVAYLHSEIKTLERLKILNELRTGKYDVIVGINLLREGIDLPEVSLIAILDADKQGFLRSYRSLVQTIGRCARNSNGHVILYADKTSEAMKKAIEETDRRRSIQQKYNEKNNITPETIKKEVRKVVSNVEKLDEKDIFDENITIKEIEEEMKKAADNLEFERAVELRDILFEMKSR